MNNTDQQILAEKILKLLKTQDWGYEWEMSELATSEKQEQKILKEGEKAVQWLADQLLELVMAEKEKTIQEVKRMLEEELPAWGVDKKFFLRLEHFLKQPQTSSPSTIAQSHGPSEDCDCCYHKGCKPSCPFADCQHCQPEAGREGKK